MLISKVALVFFVCFITGTLSSEGDVVRKEPLRLWSSSESSSTFNPFSLRSWFNLPSQVLQFWFPFFRPAYYPPNIQQKPGTVNKPNKTETNDESSKPKTDNIFDVSGSDLEDVEYLPSANEIEWSSRSKDSRNL